MLENLRRQIARLIAPAPQSNGGRQVRMYASARPTKNSAGWPTLNGSADTELVTSLTTMRSASRALVRDAAYAKRAKVVVQNNVIGSGIGIQAQVKTTRDQLNQRVNDAIEEAFCGWSAADNCHTGGALHFADLERQAMGQIFEAGEVFFRKHYTKFGDSSVPYALELIEAERIADDLVVPPPATDTGLLRMGLEIDKFYRPVAYWIRARHPGEVRRNMQDTQKYERVPAEQIIHLRLIDRWPQTRGEPWLHAVIRKLSDMDGYSEAEITAARAAACYMGFITSPDGNNPLAQPQADGTGQMELSPGAIDTLAPGETFEGYSPNRPNANMDPFMRMMLREVASGVGTSYEALSRDYSQSNYSSSRLSLLDDRDLWRVLQGWFIRNFRQTVHREWLSQAVMAGAIPGISVIEYGANMEKFEAVRFKPRGWSWVDPTKEVEAYREAVRCGFMTVGDVIAKTGDGMDLEDVLDARRLELDMMKEKDLVFDTDPVNVQEQSITSKAPDTPAQPTDGAAATDGEPAADASKPKRFVALAK